jgi:hypothetical protein
MEGITMTTAICLKSGARTNNAQVRDIRVLDGANCKGNGPHGWSTPNGGLFPWRRRFAPTAVLLLFVTQELAGQTTQPPQLAVVPDCPPASCPRTCSDVTFSGGSTACQNVADYPCVKQLIASVTLSTAIGGSCPWFMPPIEWEITYWEGGQATGIELQYTNNDSSISATATLIFGSGSKDAWYKLKATGRGHDGEAVPKIGWFRVRTDACTDCGADDTCPVAGPAIGAAAVVQGSVSTQIRMGRSAFGKPAGALSIHEKYPTNLLCRPAALGFLYAPSTNSECEVLTNNCGIRQVRVPEGLANVVTNSQNTNKYWFLVICNG